MNDTDVLIDPNYAGPVVEAAELYRIFAMGISEVRALDGLDLRIERGEMVAIMGASGSGKSTLLYLLGCLDRPTAGSYRLMGQDVAELDDEQLSAIRNTMIGFVFQTFHLIPQLTVLENAEVPLFYGGVHRHNRRERAASLLEMVGLGDRMHHRPNELSGGQMQRVAIARALVNDPVLLLADEPTGNLDSHSGDEILKIFDKLHEAGRTIVVITHDSHIGERCERIVHLRDGKVVLEETPPGA
jgi:putative ABC transport system ATP-binding protein